MPKTAAKLLLLALMSVAMLESANANPAASAAASAAKMPVQQTPGQSAAQAPGAPQTLGAAQAAGPQQAVASPLLAPTEQVRAAERGFAQSMADRNHAKFAEFISEESIFFTAKEPYRGKQEVVAGWLRFFQGKEAPFSWQPDKVEVLASGNLALSTGPVYDPSGQLIAHFTSIWRQEAPGIWRVIFDKGESVAAPVAATTTPATTTPAAPAAPAPASTPAPAAPAKGAGAASSAATGGK